MAEPFEISETFIKTNKGRCRMCFACVRDCPARAIKLSSGQATIVYERCIGCGNCVKMCNQGAKEIVNAVEMVYDLLNNNKTVACLLDPSYPAEFKNYDYRKIVGLLKELGFRYVNDVSIGYDLIGKKVKELVDANDGNKYISSQCAAAFYHIKQYNPDLVPKLTKLVSPMLAAAKALKKYYGDELKIVYVGPCIAKRAEAASVEVAGFVDAVITFKELRNMGFESTIELEQVDPAEFDPPLGRNGIIGSLPEGTVQSVGLYEDVLEEKIVKASGRMQFMESIKEYENKTINARYMNLWVCQGCIMGVGNTTDEPYYRRRSRVIKHAKEVLASRDTIHWQHTLKELKDIDLSRDFIFQDRRLIPPKPEEIREILTRIGKKTPRDELNCGACGYPTCREFSKAIFHNLAEDEMCLPHSIFKLHKTIRELAKSNEELANTKDALHQSEKLANMGQLSAGIAHELNNPLSVVLMYANLLTDQVEPDSQASSDIQTIIREVDRCRKIVSGLLNFARKNKLVLSETNLCDLVNKCLKVTQFPENISFKTECKIENPVVQIDKDQIIQVLHNLINNAIHAMPEGGTLSALIDSDSLNFKIMISDTGIGIPEQNIKKIFEPFFTTKKMGQGTGLGLAISHGIIKMHQGGIFVKSNTDKTKGPVGTTFTISFPKQINQTETEFIG